MTDLLQEAVQRQFATKEIKQDINPDTEFTELQRNPVETEKKVENTVPQPTAEKPEDKSVLSNNVPSDKPVNTEVKAEVKEIKIPTFEELLAERTEGKIKSWEEIEAKLNEPKIEFANEQVQKINDFVKNGGKFDDKWLYFQSTDFTKITDPFELLSEAMRLEEPGITDKEIEYRIKNDYKTDEWSENEDEATEVEEVMSAKMQREANKAKQKLIDFKEKSSLAPGQKSEADVKKQADFIKSVQLNWEKSVDENVKGFEKIPVKIDEKETFDVIVSDNERKALSDMVKPMGNSINPLLSKFMDDKGFLDVKKMQNYLYKAENFENAVKTAYSQGMAKGQLTIVKDIKNIKFNSDGQSVPVEPKTVKQQVGEQLLGLK